MKIAAPCSRGVAVNGRRCPRFEHACRTAEGDAVWDAVQRAGAWTGGGMTPRRVDRQAVHARLAWVPAWIVETLLDAFEPAALNAVAVSEKRRRRDGRRQNGACKDIEQEIEND